jgi:thiamine biosynthesis protein ThiI
MSDTLILRPLISHDKEHIIDLAREIGTEDFARTMPEYCGVISKSPTVKAVKAKIEAEEENFDFASWRKWWRKRPTLISAILPSRPSRKWLKLKP